MGILTKALQRVGSKSIPVGYPALGWAPSRDYIGKVAGMTVNGDLVLGIPAAWSCVTLISRSVARLPLFVYRRTGDDNKEVDRKHPLYPLLHDAPNPAMTSFSWRSAGQGHVETWGNHYAEIERNQRDQIIGIHPRPPERWRVDWKAGSKVFYYTPPDGSREIELPAERVFHVPAFSTDGLVGYAPVTVHRKSMGLTAAAMEYGTRVFANDARPGIVIKHPKVISPDAVNRLRSEWAEDHAGPQNAGKPGFLEEGMDITAFGFPPEDAQFLETRQFQREEMDDIFGIPRGFNESAEAAMTLKFVVWGLGPRLVMWEQEIKRQLLADEPDVFAEFAMEGLLRGNTLERYQAYAIGRTNGFLTTNKILRLENENTIGPEGDTYLQPKNMAPLGSSEGSDVLNPSNSTGNPASPGASADTVPLVASQPSRNGRTEVPAR